MDTNPTIAVNATLYWANLTKVNPRSGKYQVDLGNLSPAAKAALEEQGVNVRNKGDEKGDFITCKSQYEITPKTEAGDVINAIVGNGSQAKVGLRIKSGTHKVHGPWTVASILDLLVTDLVAYESDETQEPINYDDAL